MKTNLLVVILMFLGVGAISQNDAMKEAYDRIPAVYSNIVPDSEGNLTFSGMGLYEPDPFYTLENIRIMPQGSAEGIEFNFGNQNFHGTLYYGLVSKEKPKYPQTVFFKKSSKIKNGKVAVNIAELSGKYDIAGWEENGKATLGYRIVNSYGNFIYDGSINIAGTGPFVPSLTIVEGPLVNQLDDRQAIISFTTNMPCSPVIKADSREFSSPAIMGNPLGDIQHEILVHHLKADTKYDYTIYYGDDSVQYSFKTAPLKGSRKPFVFAYTSDSRAGMGGGERAIYGTNAYIMKKMAALAVAEQAEFFQFTGDLINGYSSSIGETNLEYANWKKNVEPFWHYIPFYVGFGNHESVDMTFGDGTNYGVQIDKFPFATHSAERIFANNFVNPKNGPVSEDGAVYDPRPGIVDFPSYDENVFTYTYGNIAMVVLNSNYWYSPSTSYIPEIGGNPHGYVMDNQLEWLEKTIGQLDQDNDIDHIFVTIHTPAFPNAGHADDDMWYSGNNAIRPVVAGIPVEKGIIERRDEFLDILINKSEKVLVLLAGDEHNYSRLRITDKTPIYKEGYSGKKLKVSRPFWQITNGSAGAPYYGLQELPWTNFVEKFSTQYALMLFTVDGPKVKIRVVNPDTFEEIEEVVLKN